MRAFPTFQRKHEFCNWRLFYIASVAIFVPFLVFFLFNANSFMGYFSKSRANVSHPSRTKLIADEVCNLIYHRYELHNMQQLQLFLVSMNIPAFGWDILKYKIAQKILLNNASKFTMVFGGSSVTAGYDNYLHQSYPMIIEKRLKPLFSSLGIDLVVRNTGQKNVDCRLSNYCFDTMGGNDADFIGWENSFDCGDAKDAYEFIARVAYWHKAVLYYSSSGGFPLNDCPPSKVVLYIVCMCVF